MDDKESIPIEMMVCPICFGHLHRDDGNGILICSKNDEHIYRQERGIWDFLINLGDESSEQLWSRKVARIIDMREQIWRRNCRCAYIKTNSDDTIRCANYLMNLMYEFNGGLSEGNVIVELGCGSGTIAPFFDDFYYIGIDPLPPDNSSEMKFPYLKALAEALPLPGESVDLLFCKDSLNYFRDIPKVLGSADRVLKQSGVFLITEYVGHYFRKPLIREIRRILRRLIARMRWRLEWEDTWYKIWSEREILKFIEQDPSFIIAKEDYSSQEGRWYLSLRKK